ncbi:MAG: AAA family ATPase [Methylococcales bacterium]|nr:AAA family ATPase [Methylococcales bacterium]
MWVEEVSLENIKSCEKMTIRFGSKEAPYKWVTLLGENGGGKSTVLQSLGLLLAGPEGVNQLLPRPVGWVRDEDKTGKLSIKIHQGDNDPNTFGGDARIRKSFGYTLFLTGNRNITIRNKIYTEPSIVENKDKILTWLRQNALNSKEKGWFAVGFGAFRRLTRVSQILVPSLQTPQRFTNFLTQFNENEPLAAFEQWLVYLDYRISKDKDMLAKKHYELGIDAISQLLPKGNKFDSVTSEGKILFNVNGQIVPTIGLSDGFRSVLALGGDLIWRLLEAFPESNDPLKEEGVVLIDELDIHLHPIWQRDIAGWLRKQFPNLQFIVATHSPLITISAGEDAVTYKLSIDENKATKIEKIEKIASMNVDEILKSDAFKLISSYSPQIQTKIDRYYSLQRKPNKNNAEEADLFGLQDELKPILGIKEKSPLDEKIEKFLAEKLL